MLRISGVVLPAFAESHSLISVSGDSQISSSLVSATAGRPDSLSVR